MIGGVFDGLGSSLYDMRITNIIQCGLVGGPKSLITAKLFYCVYVLSRDLL